MHPRSVRAVVAIALVGAAACGAEPAEIVSSPLDGSWSSGLQLSGLIVAIDLVWTADSVKGSGSYAFAATATPLGCGGGTLPPHGTLTFAAARTGVSTLNGGFRFDNGWTPPYQGTLAADSSRIEGAFRSVDAGPCAFTLFRGLVP